METSLKKWMLRRCGWGPSDCQNCDVDGFLRASTPQSGLKVETVQDARAEISRRWERDGSGAAGPEVVSQEAGARRLLWGGQMGEWYVGEFTIIQRSRIFLRRVKVWIFNHGSQIR